MSATPTGNASQLARTASQKAFAADTPEAHKNASEAHSRAANEAFGAGDMARAKVHRRSAQKHALEAHRLGQNKAPKGAKQNRPDDDDGKVENPLTTWARS